MHQVLRQRERERASLPPTTKRVAAVLACVPPSQDLVASTTAAATDVAITGAVEPQEPCLRH